jgi:hypothetical protein
MKSFDEWNAGGVIRGGDYNPGDTFAVAVTAVGTREVERDGDLKEVLMLTLTRDGKLWGDFEPNLTNRKLLARRFGRDPMALVGQEFTLVVVMTSFGNGFQVQFPSQQATKAPPPPAPPPPPPQPRPEPPAANTRPRAKRAGKDNGNNPSPKDLDLNDPIDDLVKY